MTEQLRLDASQLNPMMTTAERLLRSFEKWRPELEAAIAHCDGTHTKDDVFTMCLKGDLHFYDFDDCFIVMEVASYPRMKIYHGFLTGGNMDQILSHENDMVQIAKALGCGKLSIAGRIGWKKIFEDRGWKFVCVTMHRGLTDG